MADGLERRALLSLLRERGTDAMSFLALKSGMRYWLDAAPPEGTGACVAYIDTATAWVAAGGPLLPSHAGFGARARAAVRFMVAAQARGRRACFFATESPEFDGMSRLLIGEQPVFCPREWLAALPRHRRLREQLRRARAKGVRVRRARADELAPGAPLRRAVEQLGDAWLHTRHIEPMGFLVAVEPFHHPEEHRYFVAERTGTLLAFLSAVPVYARGGWLVEDVFRDAGAPNGTTESLLHALMREVADSEYVTLGLTPLAGAVSLPLRLARWLSRPLFDFAGLRAFRERMQGQRWEPVWMVFPRSQSALLPLVDSLRAFANGSLARFALASFARHPSGLPWTLAIPLPLWTVALGWLVATNRASLLGFPRNELLLWIVFDALLLLVLVRAAMRPRLQRLLVATALAGSDAVLSIAHVALVGLGRSVGQESLRGLATGAPLVGTLLLAWSTSRAVRERLNVQAVAALPTSPRRSRRSCRGSRSLSW